MNIRRSKWLMTINYATNKDIQTAVMLIKIVS